MPDRPLRACELERRSDGAVTAWGEKGQRLVHQGRLGTGALSYRGSRALWAGHPTQSNPRRHDLIAPKSHMANEAMP